MAANDKRRKYTSEQVLNLVFNGSDSEIEEFESDSDENSGDEEINHAEPNTSENAENNDLSSNSGLFTLCLLI